MFVTLCARYVSRVYNHSCKGRRLKRLTNSMYCTFNGIYFVKDHVAERTCFWLSWKSNPQGMSEPKIHDKTPALKMTRKRTWRLSLAVGQSCQQSKVISNWQVTPVVTVSKIIGLVVLPKNLWVFLKYLSFCDPADIWKFNNHCRCLAQIHFLLRTQSQRRCHRSWQN